MLPHRLACTALPAACVAAIYFRSPSSAESSSTNTVSTVMSTVTTTTTVILAAGVVSIRYHQVCTALSVTPHASVVRLLNRVAMFSANLMFLCFLLFATLFLFKVTSFCSTVGDIFVYGFGTLYIWMQCILTNYMSSLYYSKNLTLLRIVLAVLSFLLLIVLLISGMVAHILYRDGGGCLAFNTFCSYLLALLFCIFLTTFDRDYDHLSVMLHNDLLLDDQISVRSTHNLDSTSTNGPQQIFSHTCNVVKRGLIPATVS